MVYDLRNILSRSIQNIDTDRKVAYSPIVPGHPDPTDGSSAAEAKLSIGALARASDIPVATLRTWERRYGYPVPERKASGHRVYPVSVIARLRRIAEALARGYRAAEVVSASDKNLDALLRAAPAAPVASSYGRADIAESLAAVERFDNAALTRLLTSDWARLGPVEFLETRIAPLLTDVGEAWAGGSMEVAHEHFLSEHVGDLLRSLRLPFDDRAKGPLVLLATLPDEMHTLGLQMSALVLSVAGCRLCTLGGDVPLDQIATQAKKIGARAVAVSISAAHCDRTTAARLAKLRSTLPRRTPVLVGGAGAPAPRAGIHVMSDLGTLHTWACNAVQQAA